MLHDWGRVVCYGGAVDALLVDDGDPASVFVDAIPVCRRGSLRRCWEPMRGEPCLYEEDDIGSEGGDEVPDFYGLLAEGACVEEEAVELLQSQCVELFGLHGDGRCACGCFGVAGEIA